MQKQRSFAIQQRRKLPTRELKFQEGGCCREVVLMVMPNKSSIVNQNKATENNQSGEEKVLMPF